MRETGSSEWSKLWGRGGFPRSYLAASEEDSAAWREGFIRTFLERDLPALGIRVPAPAMRRFWTMLAHWHGQTWNGSDLARSMGLSDKTIRNYLDILTESYMLRQLQPWHENLKKRQVKSPKIYLRDTGILHHLLGVPDTHALHGHPKVGASWEGFALEQVLRILDCHAPYFWATQSGAELDLMVLHNGQRLGFEFKFSESPKITRSMRIAIHDLHLDQLRIVFPGGDEITLDDKLTACGIESLPEILQELTPPQTATPAQSARPAGA
jgi:predicted AAA+ superfamily ATPase